MESRKYELTGSTIVGEVRTLHRIRAARDIPRFMVKAGDMGGWLENESNLSHEGDAWVHGNAKVYGNAQVYENAEVYGAAQVYENARVYGNAKVYDHAQVYENASVHGDAWVGENAKVFGNAQLRRKDGIKALQREISWEDAKGWHDDYSYLIGFLVFMVSWVYCIYTYGFLLGGGLGWIPSILAAVIAAVFWPFIIVIALVYWAFLSWR